MKFPLLAIAALSVTFIFAEEKKPNFVIILTDDQGYGDLSCFGGKHVQTPNIDRMAKEGARLTSFYVSASICTPSRASLMTGSYPKRVGMADGVNLAADPKGLNPKETTIAEIVQSAGYRTAMFGKWHLGDQPEFMPTQQGFEVFFGLPYSHDIFPRHATRNFPDLPLVDGEKVIELNPNPATLTKRFTDEAIKFIAQEKDAPFFLYLAHPMPHRPIYASPDFMERVPKDIRQEVAQEDAQPKMAKARDQLYPYAIREIDWSVGEVIKALKTQGVDDNTFVIFTSDNGPKIGSSKPLSGGKGSTLEGGMRMPTVVRWPGRIPAGKDNDEIMTTMDLLPTIAKLAGVPLPNELIIDGKDISNTLLKHAPSPHDFFLYYKQERVAAIRAGKWKYRLGLTKGKRSAKAALFDLENDLAEKKNLVTQYPDIANKLHAQATAYDEKLGRNIRPAAFVKKPKPLTHSK